MDGPVAVEKSRNEGSLENKKAVVQRAFSEAAKKLGLEGFAKFGGYYRDEFNDRSQAHGEKVSINDKFFEGATEEELERDVFHEMQHVENFRLRRDSEQHPRELLFVFDSSLVSLYQRMKAFYEKAREQGYRFGKILGPQPVTFSDLNEIGYIHPDELLALLRGYEKYLEQSKQKQNLPTEPYEFIQAFQPEDLRLLDLNHRLEIGAQILKQRPNIIPQLSPESIHVTMGKKQ